MLFWKSSTGQKPTCCCRSATLLLSYLSFKAKGSMILSTKMRPKSQLATLYFEAKKWGKWPPETQSACWPHFSKLSTSNIRDPPMLIWHNHPVKSKGKVICFYAKSFLDLDTFFFSYEIFPNWDIQNNINPNSKSARFVSLDCRPAKLIALRIWYVLHTRDI